MNTIRRFMLAALGTAVAASLGAGGAIAGEDGELATFTRIKGGAVYDFRYGVDGSDVSEEYELVHVVCTDGSTSLRVMLPVAPEDDGTVYDSNGPGSTLVKTGGSYRVTFRLGSRDIVKNLEVKPVNDPKSNYQKQFVVRVGFGDPLWKALTSRKDRAAVMLIGQGGKPVTVPMDGKLRAALASCGLKG